MLMFNWFKVSLAVSDKRVFEKELPVISDHKVVMTQGVQLCCFRVWGSGYCCWYSTE
jgi:hypothetical protein